uniref:Uncharacterized protein n=1 Tax=Arundo donax TaxID=35708 RepID=A0A0A8YG80_ARUDO
MSQDGIYALIFLLYIFIVLHINMRRTEFQVQAFIIEVSAYS